MTSEYQPQQQDQVPQLYRCSVKIEMTAKGYAMPSIHVYSNEIDTCSNEALEQYSKIIQSLNAKGMPTANLSNGSRVS